VVEQGADAVRAGVDMLQVRERDLDGGQLAELVGELVRLARGTDTKVVVSDRLDVALACGADGVHLRGDSMPAASARSIAPRGFLIGRSVHEAAEAIAAAPDVDYLIAGTVFPTPSKPGLTAGLGVAGLGRICGAVRVPVLAIGGIGFDRLPEVARSGAAGVAAIRLLADRSRPMADVVGDIRRTWETGLTP
jgi:thiamine-phosphate pyrophosphorylase